MKRVFPILSVIGVLVCVWYGFAIYMNSPWVVEQAERNTQHLNTSEIINQSLNLDRPVLPAPHQVVTELWKTTAGKKITSKRSLIFHGWITLQATILGFLLGTGTGILLAIGIIHIRAMDMSVMPWAIASQSIPILAIAPMIIVVLNSLGIQGLFPKAIISAYLSFFPVLVGMVSGLRSANQMQLDLLKTYHASQLETFLKLRLPSSTPYLFTSMKIGVAAAIVGTIVAELPTGAIRGLGARLLSGSYYGQTIQIWSALFAAAILAASLIAIVSLMQNFTLRKMGMHR